MFRLDKLNISGKLVLPLVEGGKGIAISTGATAGAWAAAGGVGTISAVNADFFGEDGVLTNCLYKGKTRFDRHLELIQMAIKGGIDQAKIAYETSNGNGRIHMNVLWEMGGCEEILNGILEKAKGIIHGITCGAGMPYKLGEIAATYGVYYYPIISSARAFSALFRRSYKKFKDLLGGVVYEDPWLAGGHNGISNAEDSSAPEVPYNRLVALRKTMNEFGLSETPIIMAGGVWRLDEWKDYIDNPEIGKIAFQFGTRPILVQENPVAMAWYDKLMSLKEGDIKLTQFSPTGFYSSAVRNDFLDSLFALNERQVFFDENGTKEIFVCGKLFKVSEQDYLRAKDFVSNGFTEALLTPSNSVVFATEEHAKQIREDQKACMGCLSACKFSSWCQKGGTTGEIPDPRTFCIQKSLQNIAHGGDVEENLMFCGHSGYRFAQDSLYANGHIPTTKELIETILRGE